MSRETHAISALGSEARRVCHLQHGMPAYVPVARWSRPVVGRPTMLQQLSLSRVGMGDGCDLDPELRKQSSICPLFHPGLKWKETKCCFPSHSGTATSLHS